MKKTPTSKEFTVCIHINYTCQQTWGSVENEGKKYKQEIQRQEDWGTGNHHPSLGSLP